MEQVEQFYKFDPTVSRPSCLTKLDEKTVLFFRDYLEEIVNRIKYPTYQEHVINLVKMDWLVYAISYRLGVKDEEEIELYMVSKFGNNYEIFTEESSEDLFKSHISFYGKMITKFSESTTAEGQLQYISYLLGCSKSLLEHMKLSQEDYNKVFQVLTDAYMTEVIDGQIKRDERGRCIKPSVGYPDLLEEVVKVLG